LTFPETVRSFLFFSFLVSHSISPRKSMVDDLSLPDAIWTGRVAAGGKEETEFASKVKVKWD
jgi:hypothetical protein